MPRRIAVLHSEQLAGPVVGEGDLSVEIRPEAFPNLVFYGDVMEIGSLAKEMGAATEVMGAIKSAIDPLNIMNPGKVLARE